MMAANWREIICVDCEEKATVGSAVSIRCKSCAQDYHRRRCRERGRAKNPTKRNGWRTCQKCGVQKEINSNNFTRSGKTCFDCKGTVYLNPGLPSEWKVPYQKETDELRALVQQAGPSQCYTCVKLPTCRLQVAQHDYKLPCQVSL